MNRMRTSWLAERHSLGAEAVLVLGLYVVYETSRGLAAGGPAVAVHHAQMIASLERALHIFVESNVQAAARTVPGAVGALGLLYLTLHLAVTGTYLVWLHRRRPAAFPLVRTTVLVASALALIGYVAFPTAPPRLAALGIADTISGGHLDLNHGLISSLYNPFAAVPSMHVGYAAIVGASLVRDGARPALRAAGLLYPALVLVVIVSTGNHFLLDAVAGVIVAAVAAGAARLLIVHGNRSGRASTARDRVAHHRRVEPHSPAAVLYRCRMPA
jgi:PAP2 superfamily